MTDKEWQDRFKRNLRLLIESSELSKSELSRRTGLPIRYVLRYTNGEVVPNAYHLSKIAEALNVPIEELVT